MSGQSQKRRPSSQFIAVADRIGRPANIKGGAFDAIIDLWEDDGPRLPCLEMGSLAKQLVGWLSDGDSEVVRDTFVQLEAVLEENVGDKEAIISAFVGPCFLEALDGALLAFQEIGSAEAFNELNTRVFDLMGERLQFIWKTSRSFGV